MRRYILALILCIITMMPQMVFAESLNLNVRTGSNITVESSFTVTVKYGSDDLDSVKAIVRYDTDMIEYISGGTSSGDSGVVVISGSSDNGSSIAFTLKFKALKAGAASISVSTDEAYDLDGNAINTPYITKNFTIETIANEPDNDETGENITDNAEDINAADKNENIQTEKNNTLLIISTAVTATILVAVCIIVVITGKIKRQNKKLK